MTPADGPRRPGGRGAGQRGHRRRVRRSSSSVIPTGASSRASTLRRDIAAAIRRQRPDVVVAQYYGEHWGGTAAARGTAPTTGPSGGRRWTPSRDAANRWIFPELAEDRGPARSGSPCPSTTRRRHPRRRRVRHRRHRRCARCVAHEQYLRGLGVEDPGRTRPTCWTVRRRPSPRVRRPGRRGVRRHARPRCAVVLAVLHHVGRRPFRPVRRRRAARSLRHRPAPARSTRTAAWPSAGGHAPGRARAVRSRGGWRDGRSRRR